MLSGTDNFSFQFYTYNMSIDYFFDEVTRWTFDTTLINAFFLTCKVRIEVRHYASETFMRAYAAQDTVLRAFPLLFLNTALENQKKKIKLFITYYKSISHFRHLRTHFIVIKYR